MNLSDIGNLICIPLEAIAPGEDTQVHDYQIMATANLLSPTSRNWLPLVVVETELDQYEVVGNSFVYSVAEEAGLEKVWCIVADDSSETQAIAQALSQDVVPQTNLSTATREEISAALDYLMSRPKSPLKGVNVTVATNRIEAAPRRYWEDLKPITKLGCKIGAGAKLKALERLFILTPEPLPEVIQDKKLLTSFSTSKLKKLAKERGAKGYSKLKKGDLVELLSSS